MEPRNPTDYWKVVPLCNFSGMSHICLQSMALELGIHVPRSHHFYYFQAGRGREIGWIHATLDLGESSKLDIQEWLVERGEGVVFYVDSRYDSS
ncbi:hypothetical protein R1sor_014062 [Riccia sorocarpa]|uniref:Uncharacterized protein n=1 Tax=Riccia sorocarpa TaxID=122646 RepID=A0ABD3H8B8_9MARC